LEVFGGQRFWSPQKSHMGEYTLPQANLGMLFWFIILFALFFFLIRSFGQKKKDALEILESRYAKGEIGKKEFEEKKKGLE
jgi:uncharacterized membrane protein